MFCFKHTVPFLFANLPEEPSATIAVEGSFYMNDWEPLCGRYLGLRKENRCLLRRDPARVEGDLGDLDVGDALGNTVLVDVGTHHELARFMHL